MAVVRGQLIRVKGLKTGLDLGSDPRCGLRKSLGRWAVRFILVEEAVALQGEGLEGVVHVDVRDVAGMMREFGGERQTLN